jgi:hypothetical protein
LRDGAQIVGSDLPAPARMAVADRSTDGSGASVATGFKLRAMDV